MIERYTRPEMGRLWTLETKFQRWLEVELAAVDAWAELGVIPRQAAAEIREKAAFSVERILEIEAEVHHDVIAFTTCVAEHVGPAARYFHYGLTSSDVVDTALASLMVDAGRIIAQDLERVSNTLRELAVKYKDLIMIGRTHGVHAEPTTFGLKLALWREEIERHRERWDRAVENVRVGKISGAVGTYANIDPRVEELVCRRLGLKPAPISTQILQRDCHAEYLTALALIAASLDKFATEIRALQKTETREVEEPFAAGQKGSSAMPHKRNPRLCEQISGLSRVVRANAVTALDNVPLWHERDISHSSAERVIIPDSTILVNYLLNVFDRVLRGLHVYPENMRLNLERTGGLVFSQRVLLALVDSGMSREDAYRVVQEEAMAAWAEYGRPAGEAVTFMDRIRRRPEVRARLSDEQIEACFDPAYHVRHVDMIFRRLGLL